MNPFRSTVLKTIAQAIGGSRVSSVGQIITLLFSFILSHSSAAQIVTNDLSLVAEKQFAVTGIDPYIVFKPRFNDNSDNARYLLVDLGTELKDVSLELFFKYENPVFDPFFKISFHVDSFPIALALPDEAHIEASTILRMDVNQCSDCLIDFAQSPTLSNTLESTSSLKVVKPSNVQNGIVQIETTGLVLSTKNWQFNDLEGQTSEFEISGGDPFIVSPRQIVSTNQLAGVYFKLTAPYSDEIWNNYQLFYQTDRHAFEAQASSILRIPDSADGEVEFMIPLHFLSQEAPSVTLLKRIRLDLPELSGKWSLLEARLIHQSQVNDYQDIIPNQLIHNKHQRATGLGLIKRSLKNVLSDLAFSIGYIILLILTSLFFLSAYRAKK